MAILQSRKRTAAACVLILALSFTSSVHSRLTTCERGGFSNLCGGEICNSGSDCQSSVCVNRECTYCTNEDYATDGKGCEGTYCNKDSQCQLTFCDKDTGKCNVLDVASRAFSYVMNVVFTVLGVCILCCVGIGLAICRNKN